MNERIVKHKNMILLGLILVFALFLRLVFFTGMDSSDSLGYAKLSYMLAEGDSLKDTRTVGLRLGILLPTSALYSIFGVNELSSNLWILAISLASIVLIYNFGAMLFNQKVGLLSALLLSFFPLDVVYSTRFLSDLPAAFFVALSVFLFLKSERIGKKMASGVLCLLSGLSLGIAYLMKELSLLIGLFFLIYAIYTKKIRLRYFFIAAGFILVFSIEMLLFIKLYGDPFYRFHVLESEWVPSIIATNMYGRGDFPSGLFHYAWVIFTDRMLGLYYPFIFIAMAYIIMLFKKNASRKESSYLLFWFIPILLYLSFGSASLTSYVPIPAASRFLSIITIPGILLLAYFLSQEEFLIKSVLMPSIILILFVSSVGYIYISGDRLDLDDEGEAYDFLEKNPGKVVYTDDRTMLIFDYFSGFKPHENIKSFNQYYSPDSAYSLNLSQMRDSYVVINRDMINHRILSKKGIKYPKEIFDIPETWVLKKEIEKREIERKSRGKIEIYYVP